MDISGLVYRNDHSASATSSSSRGGVMAPHMAMDAQPFVSDHIGNQMGNYNPYSGQFGFESSQVQQFQQHSMPVNVVQHSQSNGFGGPFPHPQHQHQHHQHHPPPQMHHTQQQHHHHPHPHQPPPLVTQRLPHQTIPRDTGQLGRAPSNLNLRLPSQKPVTIPSQTQNYAYHNHPPQQQSQAAHHPPLHQPQHQQHPQRQHPQHQQHQQQPPHPQQQHVSSQTHHVSPQHQLPQHQLPQHQLPHPPQHQHQPPPPPPQPPQQLEQPLPQQHDRRHQQAPQPKAQSPPQDSGAHRVGITKVKSPNADVDFQTDVDNLMKAIQAKVPTKEEDQQEKPPAKPEPVPPPYDRNPYAHPYMTYSGPEVGGQANTIGVNKLLAEVESPTMGEKEEKKSQKSKKRYECDVSGCNKSFFQKTHLDIHLRAHSGDKPFACREVGCGQRFSQLGNLRTHERRHTGEKPYACDICHKRFAQRGNVRAHQIVHDGAKPFVCKLDNCNKMFTQLGNLKSHQNKFHVQSLRQLTEKFAALRNTTDISPADAELFQYFAELYKNSNRGIKGRGKDRKISGIKKSGDNGSEKSHGEGQITSPNGSSGSGDGGYDFSGGQIEEEDESSVGSPYDHQPSQQQQPPLQTQQLPPMRPVDQPISPPGMGGMVPMAYAEGTMGMRAHMAKYHLDRKF